MQEQEDTLKKASNERDEMLSLLYIAQLNAKEATEKDSTAEKVVPVDVYSMPAYDRFPIYWDLYEQHPFELAPKCAAQLPSRHVNITQEYGEAFQRLLDDTCQQKLLGKGHDVLIKTKHKKLQLVNVVRMENPTKWQRYLAAKVDVTKELEGLFSSFFLQSILLL